MDNTRVAWQKSIWVFLTLEGDRKNLIASSQRTSSGLACRNVFNTQFVQLLEDYDTYGLHKGCFVPHLEPSNDPEVAFEVRWDKLSEVLHEPGTAPTPAVNKPVEAEHTLNSILEDHTRRKKQKLASSHPDEIPYSFADSQRTTEGQAFPAIPRDVDACGPTPMDFYNRFKTEFDRRKDLEKRERIGLVKKSSSGIPLCWIGIDKIYDELEG